MSKILKGDQVIVNTGKDKGKRGIVSRVLENGLVIVEGINLAKKHEKPNLLCHHLNSLLYFLVISTRYLENTSVTMH